MHAKLRLAVQVYAVAMVAVGVAFVAGLVHVFQNNALYMDMELPALTRYVTALDVPACFLPVVWVAALWIRRSSDNVAVVAALAATLIAVGWPLLAIFAWLLPFMLIGTEL